MGVADLGLPGKTLNINKCKMSETENSKTPLEKIGKFGLIARIKEKANTKNESTVLGIGDDSAVIDSGEFLTLCSTDLLLEGIHFNLIYTPLRHLGYKAVIRAISDIYAMNGIPGQILVSIGVSSKFYLEQIEELYEGIFQAAKEYGVDLAGGDTTSSLTGLTIGVTGIGTVEKGKLVKRNGAKPNDLICVTGDFGASFMGLQLLEREKKVFNDGKGAQPDLAGYEYVIGKQLKPGLPVRILTEIREADIQPTSMIDVSDGLASDLLHICKSSGVGCRIFYNKIPIDLETVRLAEEFKIDPTIPALNGGEDYELLFTIPLGMFERIKHVRDVKIIGHTTSANEGYFLVGEDGAEVALTAQGWSQNKS
jgi:thiamine-monophosphate kinase